jgi:AcrR family transcriptional regulator
MAKNEEQENADRRQQILEAALKVFGTKGFHKATNKDIADAAGGISPGLIYWYFKDKQDLFLSLIRERVPIFEVVAHPERLMDLPPREGLAMFGLSFLGAMSVPSNVAMFRLLISEAARFPEVGDILYQTAPIHILRLLGRYLQHHVERGNLRQHDTAIATRSFMGMLIVQIIAREILHAPEAIAATNEQIVATVVDIFVGGLEA